MEKIDIKNLFNEHAVDYSTYRPDYPQELFDFIFQQVREFNVAWDCGTGNGQAAKVLASRFRKVFATDISDRQLSNAARAGDIIEYAVSSAEQTPFARDQFDLITAAQAIHWFKFDAFYNEVNRVAKPNSILAVWGYGLLNINPDFDHALRIFYRQVIDPYWDPERKFIDERYQTIPFPFDEIQVPDFHFSKRWSVDQLSGYLTTWSSAQKFIKANGYNPIEPFIEENRRYLKEGTNEVQFPLFMRLGRISK